MLRKLIVKSVAAQSGAARVLCNGHSAAAFSSKAAGRPPKILITGNQKTESSDIQ